MYKYFGVYKKGRFQMFQINVKTGEVLCIKLSNKVKDTKKINIVNKLYNKLNVLIEEYREYYNTLIKEVEVKK